MHWVTIITALVLAATSAFLVMVQGWSAPSAFLMVGAVAASLLVLLAGALMLLARPEHRSELMQVIVATLRGDWNDLLRWMRIRG